jgi:hypothetical protein
VKILTDNWALIIGFLAIIACAVVTVIKFYNTPSEKQKLIVKEWLLWAVTKAETELGGGTGQLKLAMVYDLFISKFPAVAKTMPFEMFSKLVDAALDKMREVLAKNKKIAEIVEKRDAI